MVHMQPFRRSGFWFKVAAAVVVTAIADAFIVSHQIVGAIGPLALLWLGGVLLVRPGLGKDPRALLALAAAALFALVLTDRPGPLAVLLFGLMLGVAVLSARVKAGEPVWRWAQRFVVLGIGALFGPALDLMRLGKAGRRTGVPIRVFSLLGLIAVPLAGGAIFLTLFASANPIIQRVVEQIRLPHLAPDLGVHIVFWGAVLAVTGATFRPRWRRRLIGLPSLRGAGVPGPAAATITLSLVVFNAVFALQNGLDLVFLWSGAPLPDGVTLAEYAHRGAYPLIVTALLAAAFVLIALRPGSETARRPLVRGLVTVWVGQNLLLVASSILRTADYVEAYGLTRFRLAAMIWMVLVAVGLALICWRLLKDRDGHWLIDANVKALLAVLAVVSVVDLSAITAAWNVRHAREVCGTGAALDLGYLRGLGAPALVSLIELERRTDDPGLRDRLAAVRVDMIRLLERQQGDIRSHTWRDARRLSKVRSLLADRPLAPPEPGARREDGSIAPPQPPVLAPPVAAPLTNASGV